jgi:hypothetical protein
MKGILVLPLLLAFVAASAPADAPSFKQFTNGSSSSGYLWQYCREGERVNYAVFSYLDDGTRKAREPHAPVKVLGGGSRHPKATLHSGPESQLDLFAATKQIYQVEQNGEVRTFDERVSYGELMDFLKSKPRENVSAEALLAYVQQGRAAQK